MRVCENNVAARKNWGLVTWDLWLQKDAPWFEEPTPINMVSAKSFWKVTKKSSTNFHESKGRKFIQIQSFRPSLGFMEYLLKHAAKLWHGSPVDVRWKVVFPNALAKGSRFHSVGVGVELCLPPFPQSAFRRWRGDAFTRQAKQLGLAILPKNGEVLVWGLK